MLLEVDDGKSEIRNTFVVPSNFVVSHVKLWPENTWSVPLGRKIPNIRSKSYLKGNLGAHERLVALGVEMYGKAAFNEAHFIKLYNSLALSVRRNSGL